MSQRGSDRRGREAERDAARARVVHLEEVVAELREENSELTTELARARREFGGLPDDATQVRDEG